MVSPSARKKIRTSQTIEKPLFIASQPTPLSTATTKITKKSIARAVPAIALCLARGQA
jgi:hypothetical protein